MGPTGGEQCVIPMRLYNKTHRTNNNNKKAFDIRKPFVMTNENDNRTVAAWMENDFPRNTLLG